MYESFFGLSSRPFPAAPVVDFYFPTAVVEQARQTLIRIVDRAEGPGLIIGQPGLGKTLLLRMLNHHFQNVFHCIHLASAAIESRKDLLQNVLFELDLPYRNMEEGELRLSLLDFLRPSESCPHGVLLLVDEAHTLPLQLLDEIRMITNLVRDGQPRVRLVLAGDAQLDDVFADPRLDSFNQRIAARCYLEPLNQEQTAQYVQSQIATIGGEPNEIFTPEALVAIFRASGGIPRIINQVCDHSLVMASLGGYHQLDAPGIEEAWADLQQLPGPWNEPAAPSTGSGESIVEFGALDDDDAARTPAPTVTSEVAQPLDTPPAADTPPAVEVHAPLADDAQEALPDPANEMPFVETPLDDDVSKADLPSWDLPESNLMPSEFTVVEQAELETPPAEADNDHFGSNVVQVGWEANAVDATASDTGETARDTGETARPIAAPASAPDATAEPEDAQSFVPQATTMERAAEFVDPFGQGFEEEEIVIDRYADLGGSVFAGCPRVSSEEGRALAAIINQQASPQLSVVDVESLTRSEPGDVVEEAVEDFHEPAAQSAAGQEELEVAVEDKVKAEETDAVASEPAVTDEFMAEALANNVFDTSSLSAWLFASTTETVGDGGLETQAATQPDRPVTSTPETTLPLASTGEPLASTGEQVYGDPTNETHQVEQPCSVDETQPSFLQVHDGPNFNDDRDMIVIDEDKHDGVFLTQSGDDLARRVEYQQLFSQLREG